MLMLFLRYSEPLTVAALFTIVAVEAAVILDRAGGWLW